jgi:hypothetical protein
VDARQLRKPANKRAATIRPDDNDQPPGPYVTLVEPAAPAKLVELSPGTEAVIGRGRGAAICATHPTVSRRHALIRATDARLGGMGGLLCGAIGTEVGRCPGPGS